MCSKTEFGHTAAWSALVHLDKAQMDESRLGETS